MTNDTRQLGKTFFPGLRKEIRVQTISLLENTEETKRIKMDLFMSFSDGKLTGMPEWIGNAYDHLAKEGTLESYTKFDNFSIEEMSLHIFETPEQDHVTRTVMLCQLKSFTVTREKESPEDEELGDVGLKFVLYAPGDKRIWSWLYDYIHKRLWIRFESTQPELADEPKAKDKQQLTLEESKENIKAFTGAAAADEYEEDRRRATGKQADADFPPALAASGKGDSAARRPRGFDRKRVN